MLCLHAVTDEEGRPLVDEDESGTMLCTHFGRIFESRINDERHLAYETFLDFVHKAPEDIEWTIDEQEFYEMLATKRKNLRLALMVFHMVSTGALVDWDLGFC